MTPVYKRIYALKKEKGLSWNQLAKKAGIRVASWMTGLPTSNPSDSDLQKMAPVLDTTYDYLKYGTLPVHPEKPEESEEN